MDYVTYLAIAFIIMGVVMVVLSLNQALVIELLVVGVVLVVLPPVIIAFLNWRSSPRTEGAVEGSAFYAEKNAAGLSHRAALQAYAQHRLDGMD